MFDKQLATARNGVAYSLRPLVVDIFGHMKRRGTERHNSTLDRVPEAPL